ncbi:PH domain-containing protein [Luteimonas sp. 50]|uniref:PH domain-containing protein n=1 Tax=Cognatiluteimonas sedimenti TaxID=2927791 RepID=A0ABT0A598_9GAMM|nr:PH domain-containing protein [Lysobacter sedimenti]MCJ0826151.1 PH domain-containing protein [Lysobacter sedimenti]
MSDDVHAAERRLHPLSWLFVLIQQLKQFVVPLLALLLFGRGAGPGDDRQWWPLIGVGVLALASVWQYLTYRYRIEADSLVVRSGVLHRSLRQIPFARIHNVALHQSLLHRLFGVAEVRLESAGGKKPEAQMRVLRLSDALALERLVRRRGAAVAAPAHGAVAADPEAATTLLRLPPAEVLRLGLVSNRGLIVVGGGFAALSQFNSRLLSNLFEGWGQALFGFAGQHHFGVPQYALVGVSLLLAFVLLLRLFSIVLALLQYFGFRLDEHGRRLTVERGLLTRLRTSTSRRRIQAWTLREGLLHRWLGRRSLQIDSAASEDHGQQRALRELAPIATPDACDALVRHLLPRASWPPREWQPLHPRAWLRLCLPGALLALLAGAALAWRFGAWGLTALLWLPWAAFVARQHAHRAGYACDGGLVALREGWWSRHWRFAELDKLQALQLTQSPLDRSLGMATLWLDSAGAGALSPPLRLRYLPVARARALHAQLGHEVARRKLRW